MTSESWSSSPLPLVVFDPRFEIMPGTKGAATREDLNDYEYGRSTSGASRCAPTKSCESRGVGSCLERSPVTHPGLRQVRPTHLDPTPRSRGARIPMRRSSDCRLFSPFARSRAPAMS
jgi:hypothetical protein